MKVNDRRSTVSRQACHVLGAMAVALGPRFEMLAIHFLPVLFKVLIITVQVMAEAADVAAQTILHHCQTGKVVQKVCWGVTSDRNAKTRQHCTKYLLQVMNKPKRLWMMALCRACRVSVMIPSVANGAFGTVVADGQSVGVDDS